MQQIYECVILHGKKDIAGVNKLSILIWEGYPDLAGWAQYNHKDEQG